MFILLAGLFYLVPLYTEQYQDYTSAATIADSREDLVAVFLVGDGIKEGKIKDYLIVGGKTANIVDLSYDTATLETKEGGVSAQTVFSIGETAMIRGVSVQLRNIR